MSSLPIADLTLSSLRLQDDARFVWCILVPRRPGAADLDDLVQTDLSTLTAEIALASRLVRSLMASRGGPAEKINVAAIGNIVRQLHVHVVGRRSDDELWPDPVFGRGRPAALGSAAEGILAEARGLVQAERSLG